MSKYNLILVFGGPASGKGTLCKRLAENFSFVHVSPGDLVRAKKKLDSELATLMKNGKLLPPQFIGDLIWSYIQPFDKDKIILLDGFPRNQENLDYFNQHMKDKFNLVAVLVLDCKDDLIVKRAMVRAKELGRMDDSENICRQRIEAYHMETEKIVKILDQRLVKRIDGNGSVDDTYAQAFKILTALPF